MMPYYLAALCEFQIITINEDTSYVTEARLSEAEAYEAEALFLYVQFSW